MGISKLEIEKHIIEHEILQTASKKYVDSQDALYLPLTGGTITGILYADGTPTGLDVLYSATIGNHLTVGNNIYQDDNDKHIFGTGNDAEIYYDNTNLIIDPDVVGTGKVLIGATGKGDLQARNIYLKGDATEEPSLKITTTGALKDPEFLLGWDADQTIAGKIWCDVSHGDLYIDNLFDNVVGDIYFRTQVSGTPVNALTILGSGNVGIGTTTPAVPLDVIGRGQFKAPHTQLTIIDDTDDKTVQFNLNAGKFNILDPTGVGSFVIEDGAATNTLVVDSASRVGIGTATPASKLEVAGAINSATATITASSDATDVSGINTLFINITGDIVLGGLTGGVNGQTLNIVMIGNFVNHCTIEHAEGIGGSQDFINHTATDEDISHGGSIYVCNGTNWYDTSHAKHV